MACGHHNPPRRTSHIEPIRGGNIVPASCSRPCLRSAGKHGNAILMAVRRPDFLKAHSSCSSSSSTRACSAVDTSREALVDLQISHQHKPLNPLDGWAKHACKAYLVEGVQIFNSQASALMSSHDRRSPRHSSRGQV